MKLFPPRYTHSRELLSAVGWYILAKVCELLDARVFALGGLISGHTLKHLAAGMATFLVLRMLKTRRAVASTL